MKNLCYGPVNPVPVRPQEKDARGAAGNVRQAAAGSRVGRCSVGGGVGAGDPNMRRWGGSAVFGSVRVPGRVYW